MLLIRLKIKVERLTGHTCIESRCRCNGLNEVKYVFINCNTFNMIYLLDFREIRLNKMFLILTTLTWLSTSISPVLNYEVNIKHLIE